jgi:hypothetical protein
MATPIGNPITLALTVAIAATCTVNQITLSR